MIRWQFILMAALMIGGIGLSGCERESESDGVRVEAEVEGPRENGTLDDVGSNIERGMERTGENIERGVEQTGDALERAGDDIRD